MKMAIALALLASPAAASEPIERTGSIVLNGRALPFSNAVRAGDMVYLSGQIGLKPDGTLPEGFEAQARQAMDNIEGVLKSVNLGWGDVTKCTVMLDNMADWPKFNPIYASYFPDQKFPARSAFGTDGLALGALLEVECWAYTGKR